MKETNIRSSNNIQSTFVALGKCGCEKKRIFKKISQQGLKQDLNSNKCNVIFCNFFERNIRYNATLESFFVF